MIGKKGRWLGRERQYRLVRVIAEDGLGTLWEAENAFLNRPVTARVVSEALSSDPRFVVRFRDAMSAISRSLSHPNAAIVFNYNWEDGSTQFVVMEAIEGETLEQRLERVRSLEPVQAMRIAAQVVDALGSAHAAGIVHGGLTPRTVVVSAEDEVKVFDFGVAAAAWDHPAEVLSGSPGYAAPEWVLGAKRRPSWDVYSAAILLHHMVSGVPKVTRGSNGLPPEVAEVWTRAMADDPRQRASAGELGSALHAAISS